RGGHGPRHPGTGGAGGQPRRSGPCPQYHSRAGRAAGRRRLRPTGADPLRRAGGGGGMTRLVLVGIGTGSPDHITRQGVAALNAADLILIPDKGAEKADLADARLAILRAVLVRPVPVARIAMPRRRAEGDYLGAVSDWHDAIAAEWAAAIVAAGQPQTVAPM